jgi:hypothetical protein
MNQAPRTTEVFDDLIAALQEIRDGYVLSEERFTAPIDIVEGYRYVGQVLSMASELFIESDPEHPRFVSIVSPERKLQGDNPDAVYHFARVDGAGTYRVSGAIGEERYTSFTVHAAAADGGLAGAVLADVNHHDLDVAADGSYSVVFSPEQQDGNWIRLEPEAYSIFVRSYFQNELSVQNDPMLSVKIGIERLDDTGPPPPLDDSILSERFAAAVKFLRQVTVGQALPGAPSPAPFVSDIPNDVPKPYSFRDSGLPVPGAVDIWYSLGRFELEPDEAMVMSGELPECEFANVMLWNAHMQTFEYRSRTSSVNQSQLQLEADGGYRIVIAHSDPGVPNWLDTGGHAKGTIFWRFLLPATDPHKPECDVVPLGSLRG